MNARSPAALLLTLLAFVPVSASESGHWRWPFEGHQVARAFDLPDSPYGAGNRGVDLRGRVGEPVRSVAPGVVSYVGMIDRVRIVVVDHGTERSTYQPVAASVEVGDAVDGGQVIGTLLGAGSHCADGTCLHLGRKAGDSYLDPLALMSTHGRFRLINPDGAPPPPPSGSGGSLRRPVGGPVTSPYGMRVHPVTHERKLHDGIDFGVPCGTTVHAAGAGIVTARGFDGAYGNRIVVEHDGGLTTSYNHLTSESVPIGARVRPGQDIGRSGTSGLSTGCHLHFMVQKDGRTVNPMGFL